MNRPLRKLLAFSAATAMIANVPIMCANAKYVAEQVGGKEFDSMIQYPDRNVYIENGNIENISTDQQLVVVGTDGTTKLISLSEGIEGGISYASTTMGIYDFLAPTTAEFGFDFYDESYRVSSNNGISVISIEDGFVLMDKDGKVLSEKYDGIFNMNGSYFNVKKGNAVGVIDVTGKVIIPPSEEIKSVYITSDEKNFLVNGNSKDYFTDLSGKVVTSSFDDLRAAMGSTLYFYWSAGSEPSYNSTLTLSNQYYESCKDGKYALVIGASSEPVTDYFDILDMKYDSTEQSYYFIGKNEKRTESGEFNYEYILTYFDAEGKVTESKSNDYDTKEYGWTDSYILDENDGKEVFFQWAGGNLKCSAIRYYLHKKNYGSYDGLYDQILDSEMNVVLEADTIQVLGFPFGFTAEKDGKINLLNGKLEKIDEFNEFKESGAVSGFIGKKGDKYYIYNRALQLSNDNADAELFSFDGAYPVGENKLYYIKNGANVTLYNSSYEEILSYTFVPKNEGAFIKVYTTCRDGKMTLNATEYGDEEGSNWLGSQSVDYYFNNKLEPLQDTEYDSIKLAGDYFYVYKNGDARAKLITAKGKLVREVAKDTYFLENGYYAESENGVVSFSDASGKLIRKFNSSYGFNGVSSTDLTNIILNDKNAETGVCSSYIYDLTTDKVKYSQTGKYDMIDMICEDYIRVLNAPDDSTDSSLWTDDQCYETGLVRIDGTEMIAPCSGQSISFNNYCYGSYSRSDYRDLAIDTIYNNGPVSEFYANEKYLNPMGTAEDIGLFVVLNGVYIPLKDLDPLYSSANGYGTAIKTQYGTYVVIKDGKWGIAGKDGKPLSEIKYDQICEFADGIAWTLVKEEKTIVAERNMWVNELRRSVSEGEEYKISINKLGLITKDGKELVEPYYDGTYSSNHNDIEHFGNTYFTRRAVEGKQNRYEYGIYRGADYFNDFTAKYDYDTAVQYGDLYLVSKNGLKGVVTSENEIVLPIEFAEVLWFPGTEKIVLDKYDEETNEILSNQHFSSAISDLDDGSKLINVKTSEGKIRAYQIRDVEETTITTTVTTSVANTSETTTTVSSSAAETTTTVSSVASTTAVTSTSASSSLSVTTTSSGETTAFSASATSTTASQTTVTTTAAETSSETTVTTTSGQEKKEFDGEWYYDRATSNGETLTMEGAISATLNSNGTGKLKIYSSGQLAEEHDFIWTGTEDTVYITISNQTLTLSYDSDTDEATFTEDGVVMYFKRGTTDSSELSLGDANGDGNIDAKDASFILSEYAKLSTGGESSLTETQKAASDVNGDGNTDAKDASAILAYYSYLSTGGKDLFKDFLKV